MKITTKIGDRGETSLFGGRRVSKASFFVELVGQLDELQSYVGWARCGVMVAGSAEAASIAADVASVAAILDRVQDDLYRIMSIVGYEMKCPDNVRMIAEEDVMFLEKYIVEAQDLVKDLSEFVRPGSTEVAARLHIARTVCRRVERRMVAAAYRDQSIDSNGEILELMLKYLNRLSDLLFLLAYKFKKDE